MGTMRIRQIGMTSFVSLCLLLVGFVPAAAQDPVVVTGRLVDDETLEPVADAIIQLEGPDLRALTNAQGQFILSGVPPGHHRIRVHHLGYGESGDTVVVREREDIHLDVRVSRVALVVDELEVTGLSSDALERRARGTKVNFVGNEQIRDNDKSYRNIADVLQRYVSGVRIRHRSGRPGGGFCIEYRRTTLEGGCQQPLIVMDGTPISGGATLLEAYPLELIESIELMPASEGTTKYGSMAGSGVLEIRTRRPELPPDSAGTGPSPILTTYDWKTEAGEHPFTSVTLSGSVGTWLGLAAGALVARECLLTDSFASDASEPGCGTGRTIGSWTSAVALPALGAALGARLAGSTKVSKGRFLPTFVTSSVAMVPGLAFMVTGVRSDDVRSEAIGLVFMAIGTPLVAALGDRHFRVKR